MSIPLDKARAAKHRAALAAVPPLDDPHEGGRPRPNGAAHAAKLTPIELPVVSAASFAGKPVPVRRWFVPGLIPSGVVTLFAGDGGTGKSTIALQLAIDAVSGRDWLGVKIEKEPVVFLTAEDDLDEVHRRAVLIAQGAGVDLADLADLHIVSLAGLDAVMGAPDRNGQMAATPLWKAVISLVDKVRPGALILDTLSDIYGGDEISRVAVRHFMGLLRGPAIKYDLAVLVLTHPSNEGMRSGSGSSGSTAWNGSARARLYLETVKDGDGREIDADIRVLRVKKSNYGRTDLEFWLRRLDGYFEVDGPAGDGFFNKVAADAKAEDLFLELLAKFAAQGRDVTAKESRSGAPVVFAKHPDAKGTRKEGFAGAMERLLSADRIHVEPVGAMSKNMSRIALGPRPKEMAL